MFDIVICVGPLDAKIISQQIEYTKKNVRGYRNIYLIPWDESLQIEGCTTVPESAFPFSIHTVAMEQVKTPRNGWYFQQLLKVYAWAVIPDLLENYLVLDADTFVCQPTDFQTKDGRNYMDWNNDVYPQYKDHCEQLYPAIEYNEKCGIVNYMMFAKSRVRGMIETIEQAHGSKEPFWNLFLQFVDPALYTASGASEFQLYFSWMNQFHPQEICLRQLNCKNVHALEEAHGYDIVSWHWMNRPDIVQNVQDFVSEFTK
jgi:hypothetical protein